MSAEPFMKIRGLKPGRVHNQPTAASEWNIEHNLRYVPIVTVVTAAGQQVAAQVLHVSPKHVRISFDGPVAGRAILN